MSGEELCSQLEARCLTSLQPLAEQAYALHRRLMAELGTDGVLHLARLAATEAWPAQELPVSVVAGRS